MLPRPSEGPAPAQRCRFAARLAQLKGRRASCVRALFWLLTCPFQLQGTFGTKKYSVSSTKHVTVTFISLFLIWRKYQYFVENVQYTDWHSPHLSSSSRTVRLIIIKKSTPDITPYVLCFCFSLFRSASLMCSATAMKNKSPFLGEMSVRNGFKKKRLMRRADSTYITCGCSVNYALITLIKEAEPAQDGWGVSRTGRQLHVRD